jgi:hypothetical protein
LEKTNIETGADRLVNLVNRKKKVSIDEAARELGVGHDLIKEWSGFLEDEGLVTIEEKLSNTFLCEAKLDQPEFERKSKDYSPKKDAFIEEVEIALSSLQNEFQNFDHIKGEIQKLYSSLGVDLGAIDKGLSQIKYIESFKDKLEQEIADQKAAYQKELDTARQGLNEISQKYHKYTDSVSNQLERLIAMKTELAGMEEKENALDSEIERFRKDISSFPAELEKQKGEIQAVSMELDRKIEASELIADNIVKIVDGEISPLIDLIREDKFLNMLEIRQESLVLELKSNEASLSIEKQHQLYGAINEISYMIALLKSDDKQERADLEGKRLQKTARE